MIRFVTITAIACACASQPPVQSSCDPLVVLDEIRSTETPELSMGHDGVTVCVRVDATAIDYPHLEVSGPSAFGPSSFLLDLRDAHDGEIAMGVDVMVGTETYQAIKWDPAGGASYDVLLNVKPGNPNVASAGAFFNLQLTPRL
jgi:hypothetical protein